MKFILSRRYKFYTKEVFRFFKFALLALAFILALIIIKYKPVYEVRVSGELLGYVKSKNYFKGIIHDNIENYDAKNVLSVSIPAEPEYQIKFVNKKQQTSESDILIAIQKSMVINYQYFDIFVSNEKLESVDTWTDAQVVLTYLKEKNSDLQIEIKEVHTRNVEDIKTDSLDVAKSNILNKLKLNDKVEQVVEENTENVNGIKIASLPVNGNITSRYGVSSRIRVSTHTGLDIGAVTGTPIKVVANGTVESACYSGSYGNLIKINHGNGVETWYGHTSKMYVKAGQKVQAGDIIAEVGSTGNSTGPHLHFEIRINGQHVNPQNYLYN